MGALLAPAYHYQGEAVLNRLMEEQMGSNVLDEIFAQRLEERVTQGVARGPEQGRAEEARLLRRYLERRYPPPSLPCDRSPP